MVWKNSKRNHSRGYDKFRHSCHFQYLSVSPPLTARVKLTFFRFQTALKSDLF